MGKKRTLLKNSSVSFNKRLSEAEKLKIIKYVEERSIYAASNYMEFQNLQLVTGLKKGRINAGYQKISTVALHKDK